MLEYFYRVPRRRRELRRKPLADHIEALAEKLHRCGFTRGSGQGILNLIGKFNDFARTMGIETAEDRELSEKRPGMMTLIALAISVAYGYSSLVVFGLPGEVFFWELATLIDIMLLGHWIEMRSVMGASSALEELVRLMPAEAHRLRADGTTEKAGYRTEKGDRVLVKPGEKVPTDGLIVEGRTNVERSHVDR